MSSEVFAMVAVIAAVVVWTAAAVLMRQLEWQVRVHDLRVSVSRLKSEHDRRMLELRQQQYAHAAMSDPQLTPIGQIPSAAADVIMGEAA